MYQTLVIKIKKKMKEKKISDCRIARFLRLLDCKCSPVILIPVVIPRGKYEECHRCQECTKIINSYSILLNFLYAHKIKRYTIVFFNNVKMTQNKIT